MREESCWFCKGAAKGEVYRKTMHHPETLDRVEVAAPACEVCLGTLATFERVQGVVSLVLVVVGGGVAFFLAEQILDAMGAERRRGRATWLLMIVLMIPVAFLILLVNALVKAAFRRSARMERGNLEQYPGAEEWARLGYRWGEPSKKPEKARSRG
jgi:hypothetical protein